MNSDVWVLAAMLAAPVFLALFATGCSSRLLPLRDTATSGESEETVEVDVGGATSDAMPLPWPAGVARRCTQGAYGSWSHSSRSTLHDLDFDTSNVRDEEVYAPVRGIARVHEESATANFGYHVNIDLGDGMYVVIAHLKELFVDDGEEVVPGQLIGYEGCTGSCTGDHLHVGLHRGDAGQKAEFGESIPASYFAGDDTAEGEVEDLLGDAFVCGLFSLGDAEDGHLYRSLLRTPLHHPDGTLVKTPDEPEVYLVEHGSLRWIVNEETFYGYGWNFEDVVLIADEEGNCYEQGSDINQLGLVDTGFGFREGSLVREESKSDVYVIVNGIAEPIIDWDTYLLAGFGGRDILVVLDGQVEAVQGAVGDCATGVHCLDTAAITTCNQP